jgi:hypothetical protein
VTSRTKPDWPEIDLTPTFGDPIKAMILGHHLVVEERGPRGGYRIVQIPKSQLVKLRDFLTENL